MNLQILVPTINKTKTQIHELCDRLNIKSDCIIANQNGTNEKYSFLHNGFNVLVICTNTVGVSKNRNVLLRYLSSSIGLMLDDDCIMHQDYVKKISDFFENHQKADLVLFNGVLIDNGESKLIHNQKTKLVKKYHQISYAGAPGLCFKKSVIDRVGLSYDESLGVPNYIVAGEDTVFHYMLLRSGVCFYRSSETIFDIIDNNLKSSYYMGVDKRYVETRGYVTYYIHPHLFFLYKLRHCIRFKKESDSISFCELIKYFNNGKRLFKIKKGSY